MTTQPPAPLADAPEALCPQCIAEQGLCHFHERGILPQLAQPFWYQLVGKTAYQAKAPAESPEGRKVRERKERKAAKRSRLSRAMAGEFTPVSRAA